MEPNKGHGGDHEKYSWTQQLSELEIDIPFSARTKSRDLAIDIQKKAIKVGLKNSEPILQGELFNEVKPDECSWTIDKGTVTITLFKANSTEWWPKVVTTEPEIDTKKIEPESSKPEEEFETADEKIISDQEQHDMDKTVPHELKKDETTRKLIGHLDVVDDQKYEHYKELGSRLRTLLRLPKAYRWACCEWFTANIDQTLLAGENDFCAFLRDTFPNLRTRKLTRTEWCKIRRLMGKPRRCSQAFLAEERALLANKRQKIRQLQQQKVVDVSYYRDLPAQIPLSLVIGTRITAYLHKPHDALYTGIIDAVDTSNHGYRITFERPSIGTHTVPDYEVVSFESPEMLPLNAFQTRIQPRMPILRSPKFLEILGHQVAEALSGKSEVVNHTLNNTLDNEDTNRGQYPIKLLALMARVTKILSIKRRRIYELKSMNDEVERLYSLDQEVPIELKRSYASTILDLEKLNVDLDDHLKAVQSLSNELSLDSNSMPSPELVRNKCSAGAKEILDSCIHKYKVTNEDSLTMISHMVTLMHHLKSLSESEDNALQLKALDETIHDYKSTLAPHLIPSYEDNVEVHVNYIKKWTG